LQKVLVTGGAGFIGSWTVDLLLESGYDVRILDNLQKRVHPHGAPPWLAEEASFQKGDVAVRADMEQALEGVDYVIHLAAYQDYMPDFSQFIRTNTESSALLFELIVSDPKRFPVKKIVFASSQSVSGEGKYYCPSCVARAGVKLIVDQVEASERVYSYANMPSGMAVTPAPRSLEQLQQGDWDHHCVDCGGVLQPLLIDEGTVTPGTSYAISKYAIELLADRLGRRYGIPTACMRYTYVQGPRNSFYNAYSGIARRFALLLLNGLAPSIYEDGQQLRDYINVRDVARANVMVMEDSRADFGVFNVGGNRSITVVEFAQMMLDAFDSPLSPAITGEFRLGDTRHTISDTSALRALGWEPKIPVEQNVAEYVAWMKGQQGTSTYLEEAERIMRQQNVIRQAA
jgi:dTDP-L-rhamnose 4-epimerase